MHIFRELKEHDPRRLKTVEVLGFVRCILFLLNVRYLRLATLFKRAITTKGTLVSLINVPGRLLILEISDKIFGQFPGN